MFASSCSTSRSGFRQWLSFCNSKREAVQNPVARKRDFYMSAMLAASGSYSENDYSEVFATVDTDSVN